MKDRSLRPSTDLSYWLVMWEWLRYLCRWIECLGWVRWYSAQWKHLWSFVNLPVSSWRFSVNRTLHNLFSCSVWTHLWFWLRHWLWVADLVAEARHSCFAPRGILSLCQTCLSAAWSSHISHERSIEKCRDLSIRSSGEWVTRSNLDPCD